MRLTVLLFAAASLVVAQTAQITGITTDASQSVVPAVKIVVTDVEKGTVRRTVSNGQGNYSVPLLPPGMYRITAQADGFRPLSRDGIQLEVEQIARIDFVMEIGTVAETVEVSSAAPLLDAGSSSLGEVIDNKRVVDLPINGRNSYGFAALVPGVRASSGFTQVAYGSFTDQFISINGSRSNQSKFYLDGGANSTAGFNGPGLFPSVDLVQEYKVQTNNISAEFGNVAGGVINVITKSGTNRIHGSVYEFLRNDKLTATDFFVNQGGLKKAPFRFNQFGLTVGGPVILPKLYNGKDRTFFFASYEGLRWVRSYTTAGSLPTLAQRAGDFSNTRTQSGQLITIYDPVTTQPDPSRAGGFLRTPFPGNIIPLSRFDPIARNILQYTPFPNQTGNAFTATNNFITTESGPTNKNTSSVRLDHSLNDSQKFFFRYSPNYTLSQRPDVYGSNYKVTSPTTGVDHLHQLQGVLDYTNVVTPSIVVQASSSVLHYFLGRRTPGVDFNPTTLGFPSALLSLTGDSCFPTIAVNGLGTTVNVSDSGGGYLSRCNVFSQSYDSFYDYGTVTYVRGDHTMKAGLSFGTNRWGGRNTPAAATYTFSSSFTQGPNPQVASASAGVPFASYLLGLGTGNIQSDSGAQIVSYHYYGIFIQDDWKLTRRLTLNLGFRYDYNQPWTERFNRVDSFDGNTPSTLQVPGLNLRGGLTFPGVNGLSRGNFDPDRTNFAPRFGFAFQANASTVVRGGYGIFFAPINGAAFNGNSTPNSGFTASTPWISSYDGVTPVNYLSNPFPSGFLSSPGSSLGLQTLIGQNVVTMDRGRRTPYAEQWNFTIQHSLPGSLVLETAYAGSRGIRLFGPLNYNVLPSSYLQLGDALKTLVPNPFFGTIASGTLANGTVPQGQLLRPYPQFTAVTVGTASYGASTYHALQAKLSKRFAHGFGLLVSYTFSKLMDDVLPSTASTGFAGEAFSTGGIQDYYNRRNERSVASYDTPHILSINSNWELPFGAKKAFLSSNRLVAAVVGGWQVNGIAVIQSGAPLGFTDATNTLGNFGDVQRPNWTGQPAAGTGPISQRLGAYFNVGAFAVAPPYTFGNTPRVVATLRAPGVVNMDLSLFRNIPVRDRVTVQFRAEAFNLLNHPQFGFPNTSIGSQAAGVISQQANFARDIQFALKILF